MVRKKNKTSIGAAAPSPSSASALTQSSVTLTKHKNIILKPADQDKSKSPVAASTPKSSNGAGRRPDPSRSSSSEMDLKARYLKKIKKRKHREEREPRGSRCRDELSLEVMAAEEPEMSCVSKPSRKKHKSSARGQDSAPDEDTCTIALQKAAKATRKAAPNAHMGQEGDLIEAALEEGNEQEEAEENEIGGPRRKLSRADKAAAAGRIKARLPRYLRLNTLKGMCFPEAKRALASAGHALREKTRKRPLADRTADRRSYDRDPDVPGLLTFKPKGLSNLSAIPLLRSGHLVAQQKASCFPAMALLSDGRFDAVVVDACAAPGSKTSHLAALMQNRGAIVAFDRSPQRVSAMRALLALRNVTNTTVVCGNFLGVDPFEGPHGEATHLLVDPSCSSTGMSDRPHDDPDSLGALTENQLQVLTHALRFPKAERVAYSTCSVLDEENELLVQRALATVAGAAFELEKCLPWWPRRGRPLFPGAENCLRTTWDDGTIGFFLAVFRRRASA